jgi:hypothetical protein
VSYKKDLFMVPVSNWIQARVANEAVEIKPSLIHHAWLESEMSDLCSFGGFRVISRKHL